MFFKKLLNILKYSFFSKEFYIDLFINVKGLQLKYFLTVVFITNISFILPTYIMGKHSLDQSKILSDSNLYFIKTQLPRTISIQDHILEIPKDIKEIIYLKNGTPAIGFVINNNIEKLKSHNIPIIINKNGTFIRATDYQYIFIDFSLHMPKESFISISDTIEQVRIIKDNLGIVFIVFYVISTLIKTLMIALNLLFFAIFGLFYMKIQKVPTHFLSIYRVSIFASLPSLLIESIFNIYLAFTQTSVIFFQQAANAPLKTNIVFCLAIGYFFYALFNITKYIQHQNPTTN